MSDTHLNIAHRFKSAVADLAKRVEDIFNYRSFLLTEKHLLILKLDSIGDYLLFRNFLAEVRSSEKYKGYKITLCGNSWWQNLSLEFDKGSIDEFIWVDYSRLTDGTYFKSLVTQLRSRRFRVALSPTFSRSMFADELVLQSGARTKIAQEGDSVNLHPHQKKENDKKFTELVSAEKLLSFEFERNQFFFQQVLEREDLPERPFLAVSESRRNRVVICPGAKDAARQWRPRYFYELCQYLKKQMGEVTFVICGAAGDKPLADEIRRSGNDIVFEDLSGTLDLRQLTSMIAGSRLLLCNDSAPYHIGALVNTPLICISNGNHYQRFCPYPRSYGKKNLEIFPPELSAPDLTRIFELQQNGSDLDINGIHPSQVINRIEKENFLNEIIDIDHKP